MINLTIHFRIARFFLCRNFVTHASCETTGESLFSATVTLLRVPLCKIESAVTLRRLPRQPFLFQFMQLCNFSLTSRNVKEKYQNEDDLYLR